MRVKLIRCFNSEQKRTNYQKLLLNSYPYRDKITLLLKYEGKIKHDDQELGLTISVDSRLFLEHLMTISSSNQGNQLRLVVTGSAIYKYASRTSKVGRTYSISS